MKKFYLVTEWRLLVVEADSQSQALERARELDGPMTKTSTHALDYKSSRGCRFCEPVEHEDWWGALKKFREGPAAGLGL